MALAGDLVIRNQIEGFVRGSNGLYEHAHLQPNTKDLMVAQGLPEYTEMTRKGNGYSTMAVSAVAGLVVRPTTVAALEIFNNLLTASLIIDRIFTQWLVTTNVVESAILYAMVTRPKAAPSDAALVINSASGKAPAVRSVFTAAGTTVVDNGWFPWGISFTKEAGGVVPHGGIVAEVEGRLIVPPACSLCLHVLASLVGDTFTSGASWFQEDLTLL